MNTKHAGPLALDQRLCCGDIGRDHEIFYQALRFALRALGDFDRHA